MNKAKLTKIGLIVVVAIFILFNFLSETSAPNEAVDAGFSARMAEMASRKGTQPPVNATHSIQEQKADVSTVNNTQTQKTALAFKAAPEYSDIFAAAQLLNNALNTQLEKQWVDFRLGSRIARENEERAEAELKQKQHELKRLEVVAKIDAINAGAAPSSISGVDVSRQSVLPTALELTGQSVTTVMPKVSVMSYTVKSQKNDSYATLKIDDEIYDNVSIGHYIGDFKITLLQDANRCVGLVYKATQPQTRCAS